MQFRAPLPILDQLHALSRSPVRSPAPRIERLTIGDAVFWVKRPEHAGLRTRLLKGDPRRAFETERQALYQLNAAGAPVAPICADGRDFFVTPDCGLPLGALLQSGSAPPEALEQAALALARLHRLGFAHGRPGPKDMCLMDGEITLIDFERYRPELNTPAGQARDLVLFAFNVIKALPESQGALDRAAAAYRSAAPADVWPLAGAFCRRFAWARWLAAPARLRGAGHAGDFRAIPAALDFFARD